MDTAQIDEAKEVLSVKQSALELTQQFISNHALRLDKEQWHVPRYGSDPIVRLNGFGTDIDAAFSIARRWSEVAWTRVDLCSMRSWHGQIDGIVLVINHVTGDQPVDDGETINLFPGQVDDGAGI